MFEINTEMSEKGGKEREKGKKSENTTAVCLVKMTTSKYSAR